MKQQLLFYKSVKFLQYTSIRSKIIEILVKSVMKTVLMCLQHVYIKSNERGVILLSTSKKSLKKSNQKQLSAIRMHLSGMSFYINPCSQYSLLKDTSKILFRLSAPNGRMCCFCEISFKCSINQLLEYHDLTKFISAKLLTNFTFALQRIPEWKFLIIFCCTELLFPRHSESD